jgi:hypothetical protein
LIVEDYDLGILRAFDCLEIFGFLVWAGGAYFQIRTTYTLQAKVSIRIDSRTN